MTARTSRRFQVLLLSALCAGMAYAASHRDDSTEFLLSVGSGTPDVAMTPSGDFVATWVGSDGDRVGILGGLFDAGGNARGGVFAVNTHTTGFQLNPSLAMDRSGDFVIVWESSGQDGDRGGIFARRYDAKGTSLTGELQVNLTTAGDQTNPSVAMTPDGRFVVVWESNIVGGGIVGRLFDPPVRGSPEILLSEESVTPERTAVAMNETGQFVVAWGRGLISYGGWAVYGGRFDSTGSPIGEAFQVSSTPFFGSYYPGGVSMSPAGAFVIVWEAVIDQDLGGTASAALYDPEGAPIGGEIVLEDRDLGGLRMPDVVMDGNAGFVATWQRGGVWAARHDLAGRRVGETFPVSGISSSALRSDTAIAMAPSGRFVVLWQETPDRGEVRGKTFGAKDPVNR